MSSPQATPLRRRRRANAQAPTITTILDLGDDLILKIFLCLPSLPSLVRAALACRTFLAAVRSSLAFRRLFRALHQPPFLGIFFDTAGLEIPLFTPIRRRSDPDLAAAVRGADVYLTRVPYHEDAMPAWDIAECHGGRLLLCNWLTKKIAAYNPLTRALDLIPMPPAHEIKAGHRGTFNYMNFFLLSSDETPGLFRVVSVCHDRSRLRAAVFLSSTREWQVLPWSQPAPSQPSGKKHWLIFGTQAMGNLYLAHIKHAYMAVLDTTTLQVSFIDLPENLKGQGFIYRTGETKDGKVCIVSGLESTLYLWFRRAGADGVEKWMVDSVIPLEREILQIIGGSREDHAVLELKVCEVLNGVVYFSTVVSRDPLLPCRFLSFCLETRKLEMLFHNTHDNAVFPYIMAWPPSLVGNHVSP